MKKKLLTLLFAFAFTGLFQLCAQTITVVPNPTIPNLFSYTSGGELSGYAGTPFIFNNTLVLEYNASGTSDPSMAPLQLAVYNGGDSLHLIPNPDNGLGVYFQSIQLTFNNKLFFIYIDASSIQRLASFDGTSVTLYPNPDGGLGYIGSPRIYNNTLYVVYSNAAGVTQFGTFNGSGITLIPNPDNSTVGFYNDYSVVYNNDIVSRYVAADGTKHLAIYNGTSWTILPNPDNTARGVTPVFPAVYHNKLYWFYFSAANQYQFLQYDGTNNPTLIANPEDDSPNQGGVSAFPIVLNDTLFFQYADVNNVLRLAKFDGTTISLVPNPDATTYGFYNTPIVYNNNLYIFYVTPDGLHHLTQYVPNGDSLHVYPNPDSGNGYWDQPIVYDNKLFFMYYNNQGIFQLGYYDGGSVLKLITNPNGNYASGGAGAKGYTGYPVIFNSQLYMQFGSVPYGDAGNLAYFNAATLPVSLLSFTAQKAGSTSLLQWKTASEINNAYFYVEHSVDGKSFEAIGKVAGHSTISLQEKYQFTDDKPSKGLNFYRLKQVDIDGNPSYSGIVSVTFDAIINPFKIFPNPVVKTIYVSVPQSTASSFINIYDAGGKKVMEQRVAANITSQTIDVGALAAGVYNVTLVQDSQQQTIKFVKK